MSKSAYAKITALIAGLLLTCCGLAWKTLDRKDRGLNISFPCRYEEKVRNAYNCTDDWTYSYTVFLIKDPATVSYGDQLSIYEGFASRPDQTKVMNVTEREVNGFKVIEYDEDELEHIQGGSQVKKRTRFLDIFKDNYKIEVSAWAARDARHGNPDLDAMIKRDFEPFFASLKLGSQ